MVLTVTLIVLAAIITLVIVLYARYGLEANRPGQPKYALRAENMVGETGVIRTAIGTGSPGQISVYGERWRAVLEESRDAGRSEVPEGDTVVIVAVDGLTVTVRELDRFVPRVRQLHDDS